MTESKFDKKFKKLGGFRITYKQLPELFNQKGSYWDFHKADFSDEYANLLDVWWTKDCYIPKKFVELKEEPYNGLNVYIIKSDAHYSWVDVFPAESKKKAGKMWRTCLD